MKMVDLGSICTDRPCSYGKEATECEHTYGVAKVSNVDPVGEFHRAFERRDFPAKSIDKLLVENGDLLVVKSSGSKTNVLSGKTALCSEKQAGRLVASNFLMRLKSDQSTVHPRFLWHYLNSKYSKAFVMKVVGATTYPNLKWSTYSHQPIPLPHKNGKPDLGEQKRIAGILDAANELRKKRRESIAQIDTLLQSTFLDMFGDPVTNPKGYQTKLMGNIASRVTKGQSPKWQGFDYQDKGLLFVTSENVRDGFLDISKPKFVQIEFNKRIQGSELREGDLLINLVGASIGRSCLFEKYDGTANINQAVAMVSISDPKIVKYLLCLFQTRPGRSLLTGGIVEAARANISLKNLKDLRIPLPPENQLTSFSRFVTSTKRQRMLLETQLTELDTLFASLQSRAFKGELS